jgi:hypothetical protein
MDFTKLTAEMMANRKFADKWDGFDPSNAHQAFLRDVEFYHERALELTLALLHDRDNVEPFLTKDVVTAFNIYMKACICFFRSKDMNDLNQKEYLGEENGDFSTLAIKNEQQLEAEAWQELEALCGDDPGDVPYQLADTIMMRQITLKTQPNTLDRFLKYEKTEAPIILPQQKEIDLQHPDLKKKPLFSSGGVLPPEPPISRLSSDEVLPPPSSKVLPLPTPLPPKTPYPPASITTKSQPETPAEKSINDVRETATKILEEILGSVLEKFESPPPPVGEEGEPACAVATPDKKPSSKKKNKKKKLTSSLGGEALHVDI